MIKKKNKLNKTEKFQYIENRFAMCGCVSNTSVAWSGIFRLWKNESEKVNSEEKKKVEYSNSLTEMSSH